MRPCSYRQVATVAGRLSFLWDHRGSPFLCFKPLSGAHLPDFGGRGPRKNTILSTQPGLNQSCNYPHTTHCKQDCKSPAKSVYGRSPLFRCAKPSELHDFSQIL